MDPRRLVAIMLASAVVGAIIGVAILQTTSLPPTRTLYVTSVPAAITLTSYVNSTITITSSAGEQVLSCAETSLDIPDVGESFTTEITITSGNSTYPMLTSSGGQLPTTTEGVTTYLTTTDSTQGAGFAISNTSFEDLACHGTGCWVITTCTYLG